MSRHSVELMGFCAHVEECPKLDRPEFCFSGRSNVGKSSLLNQLVQRKSLAYTSKQPGKTQCFIHYNVDNRFSLVDMPGYGFARVPANERKKWLAQARKYLHLREQLIGVFQLIDSRIGPTPDDRARLRELAGIGRPLCVVMTKCDKLPKSKRDKVIGEYLGPLELPADTAVVLSSSVEGYGQREIWAWMADQLAAAEAS